MHNTLPDSRQGKAARNERDIFITHTHAHSTHIQGGNTHTDHTHRAHTHRSHTHRAHIQAQHLGASIESFAFLWPSGSEWHIMLPLSLPLLLLLLLLLVCAVVSHVVVVVAVGIRVPVRGRKGSTCSYHILKCLAMRPGLQHCAAR